MFGVLLSQFQREVKKDNTLWISSAGWNRDFEEFMKEENREKATERMVQEAKLKAISKKRRWDFPEVDASSNSEDSEELLLWIKGLKEKNMRVSRKLIQREATDLFDQKDQQ